MAQPPTERLQDLEQLGLQARAHYDRGEWAQALEKFTQLIRLDPRLAWAHALQAETLVMLGRTEEAEWAYQQALALRPGWEPALYNYANLLKSSGRFEEAEALYEKVLAANPEHVKAWMNHAITLSQRGRAQDAMARLSNLIERRPEHVEAKVYLARLLYQNRMPDTAVAKAAQAVLTAPEDPQARLCLGNAFFFQGRIRPAVKAFSEARRLAPDDAAICSRWLFSLSHDPDVTAEELVRAHQEFDRLFPKAPPGPEAAARRNGRIRLGYVSADLRNHSVANFLLPVLRSHDPAHFDVWCYNTSPGADELTEQVRELAAGWRDCGGWTDEMVAAQVREDAIDVLIDLGGHTNANRLGVFARRAAPVQAQWFGYPLGTGLSAFDARLTDVWLDPPDAGIEGNRERLVRLPVRQCFVSKGALPPVNDLPALAQGHITFGSLNSPAKLNKQVIDAWFSVLEAVPGSRLLLGSMDSKEYSNRLRARMEQAGLDPDRIEIVPKVPMPDYLQLHHRIDVLLDPFPYNGGTTTCYAFCMGVPVVSLKGRYGAARLGYSLLAPLGLEWLTAGSVESYVAICKSLAADLDELARLRRDLRRRFMESPLGQPAALTRALERALTELLEEKSRSVPQPDPAASTARKNTRG